MTEERLQVFSSTGREQPWEEMKLNNQILSASYATINPDKGDRLAVCADRITKVTNKTTGETKFTSWFCHVRLCPMCTWRRSLKVAKQMHQLIAAIEADKPYGYILLTLTQKNCQPEDLDEELTHILNAFSLFIKYPDFKWAVKGYYKAVEITHNKEENTFHPHIHAVLAVDLGYFSGGRYIKYARWRDMWQQALHVDYPPKVHVKRIKNTDMSKAIAETAKYAMKASDFLMPHDWDLTVDLVRILDAALHNRRFIGFGGIFKEYRKKLQLEDPDKADLSDLTEEEAEAQAQEDPENIEVVHYLWDACHFGYWREG